ncbi:MULTISPECIES: hypothetical protein [Streptomyces]|uniref:Uncharacterized protein n=1 Tax=Streptomyces chartreusis TaxID=1969 RepID=A0A7H8T907_STRCX|nr:MULTISPECIES: hypothetical protein [Streptomyces]MBT1092594.1 hypothetical protein [Streptomyces sp. Tu102]QKZ19985.1 hypothetical protein HUT05_23055 [Streptomyces chartreusis]GGX43655.1 hypothetical protein GCM10010321_70240 [Streptomyces chartreusis]
MTALTVKRDVLHVPETGWEKARHQRGKAIRTCMAPVEDRSSPRAGRSSTEWNIVRGED